MCYFKVMGLSYVVVQTAIENNFIPTSEGDTLNSYAKSLENGFLKHVAIGCDTQNSSTSVSLLLSSNSLSSSGICYDISSANTSNNKKVQYGKPIKVTVLAQFVAILPLVNPGEGSLSLESSDAMNYYMDTYDPTVSDHSSYDINDSNIIFEYTVPGLKYYPDLNS